MGAGPIFCTLRGRQILHQVLRAWKRKVKPVRSSYCMCTIWVVEGLSDKGTFERNATGCFRAEKCHYHVTLTTVMRTDWRDRRN